MFDRIISYSIGHKSVIVLLVFILIVTGIFSLRNLPIDALPDITNNQVQILTTSPNLATEEVELFITYPIELAIKSIPDVVELRSVSRFGLSIVTVVFEERTDIYWARNQINERLKEAEAQIPEGFGTPQLAPISTGLGEIYQYTVTPAEGYQDEYDAMALRSLQDWIIVPQLLGTRGVAEVNTLGGILKEYEVAVDPHLLISMGVTMAEIFTALQRNNENTGGAYIDKKPYAYFIRSVGLVTSLEDVGKIVVKTDQNIPILVSDVASVAYGSTARYGATTKDGKGEVVSGMVMMLKGENSAEIVSLVKDRMMEIREMLPPGVEVTPYLDRSKLVQRAISTVRTNLIEGALIVIFILVLLIGNWRAGLIVASVIPLALLFAFSLMRLFGVSGNLMSLGAIDFGLIVDGAVIIVEAIVHRLQNIKSDLKLTKNQIDKEVYQAASKIRGSAAFGEIIILIVYLPILALVGIEGKMFTPMAQTVSFAIVGAFILSLTYVPMMSAAFLGRGSRTGGTLSRRIMAFFQTLYKPALAFAMRFKLLILGIAVGLLICAIFIFTRLGGEFIPTLSEGDIATHIIIPPGSSLSQEIATTTKAEKLLLAEFPEIEQIVSKIGSAEVPTDPMPMEVADMMVILKDRSEWTSAASKEEFFEKMEHVLDDLPGVTTEFSQPIQMRFNELMTGVRSDVGVKIFGDDLERLEALAEEIVELIYDIDGVQDARAEATSGFPQINVTYDRDKVALYGLNVDDLNRTVRMGFAGQKAGVIYEREQRYDLVVRLGEDFRSDPEHVGGLFISLPSGSQLPLREVAEVKLDTRPAQISRESGKRRTIIGFNVRNNDVETVVENIRSKIEKQIDLPSGYYVEYAGQFENLNRARARLMIAVPVALILILSLLYLTFESLTQAILIFTAIPLAAIGGVFALWLRDMPFSISAGIGFIALFGVAVLNGIVMIAYFNQLKSEGVEDVLERIRVGTAIRLRPVIMTGAVASLGFLPMALSTSAGAEVQKPLATVVIGGLISATLLTLLVLPVLYYFLERKGKTRLHKPSGAMMLLLVSSLGLGMQKVNAQDSKTLSEAIEMAVAYSPEMKTRALEVVRRDQLAASPYLTPKTEIEASIGQINTYLIDQSFAISQGFNPYLPKAQRKLGAAQLHQAELELQQSEQEITYRIRSLWNSYLFNKSLGNLLIEKEKTYEDVSRYASSQFELGEIGRVEHGRIGVDHRNIGWEIEKESNERDLILRRIHTLVGSEIEVEDDQLTPSPYEPSLASAGTANFPVTQASQQEIEQAQLNIDVLRAERKPEFTVGYFIMSIRGEQEVNQVVTDYNGVPRFQGASLGVSLPLFGKGYKAQHEAAETEVLISQSMAEQAQQNITATHRALLHQYEIGQRQIEYYREDVLPSAQQIRTDAVALFESGDSNTGEYLEALDHHYQMQEEYLIAIRDLNKVIYELRYVTGK